MAKYKRKPISAKEQLLAESVLTQKGMSKSAAALSRAAIAERKGWTPEQVSTPTAAQQAAEKQNLAQLYAEKKQASSTITPTDAADTGISTSAEAAGEVSDLANSLSPGTGVTAPTFQEADTTAQTALLEEKRTQVQENLTETESYIQELFAQRKAEQESVNRQQLGSSRSFLGRAGAFSSASGQGAIQRQVQAGQQQIDQLASAEAQAMSQARQAAEDMDFELLSKQLSVADSARQEANSLRQKQFENLLSMTNLSMSQAQEARAQTSFELEAEQKTVDSITGGVISSLTGNAATDSKIISSFATQYNVDPNKLIQSIDTYNQEKQKSEIYIAQQYQSIAANIPAGSTWQDPNSGMYFIGSQEPENIEVVQTVGNTEYQVRYKMVNGQPVEQFRIELGQKWKEGSSDSTTTPVDEAFRDTAMTLYSSKQAGTFNSSIYQAAVGAFADTYGVDYGTASSEINQWLEQMDKGASINIDEYEKYYGL